jgi:hypothetical protein
VNTTPYYRTMQNPADGRWLVVHDVPGLPAAAIDASCLTQGSAALEASFMERERRARLAQEADERALLGMRRCAA